MNSATITSLSTAFQTLIHLEIRAAQFDSVNDLIQLLSSKPLLQSFSVDDLAWDDPLFDNTLFIPKELHSLHLSNCYKRDILDALLDSVPPIKHMQLGSVYPEDTYSIGRFLRRLGSQLLTLQLEFSSLDAGGDAEDFCSRVDLAHNTALHTLVLDKFINYSAYQFSSAVGWIPELLSQTLNIRELSFGVAIRHLGELHPPDDPIDWVALDRLFCDPKFPHLRTLRFWISGILTLETVSVAIGNCLPRSKEKGMLNFHRGTPRMNI
ncbi:hypothetical protein R3P38DRAFT_2508044 [Favolaschia claudopus]|uniref:Uncharacterized protein n=1 Tax=Favolaschia claudopus TaxID=2862362 RepID=A0AAW0D3S8_9AGAR